MKELILLYLSRMPGRLALPERVLRCELAPRLRDIPGEGDLAFALSEMERDGYIARETNKITGDRLWRITDEGEEALRAG